MNSWAPTHSSKIRMRRLKAGCVEWRASAAREKLPVSTKLRKSSSQLVSIDEIPLFYGGLKQAACFGLRGKKWTPCSLRSHFHCVPAFPDFCHCKPRSSFFCRKDGKQFRFVDPFPSGRQSTTRRSAKGETPPVARNRCPFRHGEILPSEEWIANDIVNPAGWASIAAGRKNADRSAASHPPHRSDVQPLISAGRCSIRYAESSACKNCTWIALIMAWAPQAGEFL